jgi:hypothetical protein
MASQIFRYSVTGDKSAHSNSWRALTAMEFLHNVTRPFTKGQPGFIARTAVRCGEPHQGPSGGVCSGHGGTCGQKVNSTCGGCSRAQSSDHCHKSIIGCLLGTVVQSFRCATMDPFVVQLMLMNESSLIDVNANDLLYHSAGGLLPWLPLQWLGQQQ